MQYNYRTEELIHENVDFSAIFPEKQDIVRESSGFEFNLQDIVSFIKKQTKNFTKDVPLAHEIDMAIYGIYQKYAGIQDDEDDEFTVPTPESDDIKALRAEVESLNQAIELLADDPESLAVVKEELASVESAIETLKSIE